MPRTTKHTPISRSAPIHRSVHSSPPPPAPAPKSSAPPPAPAAPLPMQTPSSLPKTPAPSMFDGIKQGFSFGIGSALAHSLFKPTPTPTPTTPMPNEIIKKEEIINEPKITTDKMYELYNKCVEKNDNNIDCNIILQSNTYN